MNIELKKYLYMLVGEELTYEDKGKILMYFEKLHQKNIRIKHKNKDLQERINKAIEYIKNNNLWTSKEASGYSYMKNECNELLEILKGSDKE